MKRWIVAWFIAVWVFNLPSLFAQDAPEPLKVVASTTLIADVARNVGGEWVTVDSLIPTDSDVHAFQPIPADVLKVTQADVLLVNGIGLESFLGGLLENADGVQPVVVSTGIMMLPFGEQQVRDSGAEYLGALGDEGICEDANHPGEESGDTATEEAHEHASCDPHVWTDPANVMIWADTIAEAFAAADPDHVDAYRANAAAYMGELTALDAEVRDILSVIPDERRVLVTNHEFLGYFAHAYGFRLAGVVIPGGSTLAEPDPQTVAGLIATIQAEHVPAVFVEVSSSSILADVIAQETGSAVVTTIYSDSLTGEDGPASTYLDYMRYNARTIASALAG